MHSVHSNLPPSGSSSFPHYPSALKTNTNSLDFFPNQPGNLTSETFVHIFLIVQIQEKTEQQHNTNTTQCSVAQQEWCI